MRRKSLAMVSLVFMGMIIFPALAATLVDDDQTEFDTGSYDSPVRTQWNSGPPGRVELNAAGMANGWGRYDSGIKDATAPAVWNTIAWTESIPYKEELPDGGGNDAGANMVSSVLLMHMNRNPARDGHSIADTSGQANNGTLRTGDGTTNKSTSNGRYRRALMFDGINDCIEVTDSSSLDISGAITLEAWINPSSQIDSSNSNMRIMDKQDAYYLSFDYPSADGTMKFIIRAGGAYRSVASTTSIWNQGQWYHVVGTYDGSVLRIYVNGVQENSLDYSGSINTTDYRLFLGTRAVNSVPTNMFFNGIIDEAAIYNTALGAPEILNHYKRGVLDLRVRVKSCDDPACSGESWSTTPSFYTTPGPNTLSEPNNRYFQYRARFDTEDPNYTAELLSVTIDYTVITYTVTANANVAGAGTGTVISDIGGINFTYPADNTGTTSPLNSGSSITLTAAAATGSTASWTDCTSQGGTVAGNGTATATCTYNNLTGNMTFNVTFTLNTYAITANANGNGTGNVASDVGGINYNYPANTTGTTSAINHGTSVVLTATAGTGSTAAWNDCFAAGGTAAGNGTATATCTFSSLDGNKTVTATFTLNQYALIVSIVGNGSVTSNPAGIDCGSDCSETYNHGTMITLTATPTAISNFAGWSGDCTGTTLTCTLTMDGAKDVTATFSLSSRGAAIMITKNMSYAAGNNIEKAEQLRSEAESLLKLAQERGFDASSCEEAFLKADEYLKMAKEVLSGNPIAANNFALKAIGSYEEAIQCLKSLLGI